MNRATKTITDKNMKKLLFFVLFWTACGTSMSFIQAQSLVYIDLLNGDTNGIVIPHDQLFTLRLTGAKKVADYLQFNERSEIKFVRYKLNRKGNVVYQFQKKYNVVQINADTFGILGLPLLAEPFGTYGFELTSLVKVSKAKAREISAVLSDVRFFKEDANTFIQQYFNTTPAMRSEMADLHYYDYFEKRLQDQVQTINSDYVVDTIFTPKSWNAFKVLRATIDELFESREDISGRLWQLFSNTFNETAIRNAMESEQFDEPETKALVTKYLASRKVFIDILEEELPLSTEGIYLLTLARTIPVKEQERMKKFISFNASLGAIGSDIDKAFTGLGVHYHFRPVNRNLMLKEQMLRGMDWVMARLSVAAGVTMINVNGDLFSDNRTGILDNQSFYVGLGIMPADGIFVDIGSILYYQNQGDVENPDKILKGGFFISVNFSTSIRDYVKGGLK
jgi:hypothetical protein